MMENAECTYGTWYLLVEMIFPTLIFRMWQRLIKEVNKRNSTTRKRFNVSKNMSIHFTQVNFTPINKAFSWLSVSGGGLLHQW